MTPEAIYKAQHLAILIAAALPGLILLVGILVLVVLSVREFFEGDN